MTNHERAKQIYEYRWYEGEHAYYCNKCGSRHVTYSFGTENSELWRSQQGSYCENCSEMMIWEGWSGQSDISNGIRNLISNGHSMAAIVIVAAFVEYQIDNLLWAILVDSGLPKSKASGIANGTLPRGDAIRMIRDLLKRKVGNIVFPVRNEVAHGRAFGWRSAEYDNALNTQLGAIEKWVSSVQGSYCPKDFNFTELDRWLISMQHWVTWQKQWWNSHQRLAEHKVVPVVSPGINQ
jgi:hypothetical protein